MAGSILRQAMMASMDGRMGPAHIELPDDVAQETDLGPMIPCHHGDFPVASDASIETAARLIMQAKRPLLILRPKNTAINTLGKLTVSVNSVAVAVATNTFADYIVQIQVL